MSKRKRLLTKDIEILRQLLLNGHTSSEAAQKMGVSVATVSNYRAHFKKKGDIFPNNRGRKPKSVKSPTEEPLSTNRLAWNNSYKYLINGVRVTFSDKPKSLRIGKRGMVVEY